MTLLERMRAYTTGNSPDVCWEWQKCRQDDGYGVIRVGKKTQLAHRVAWALHHARPIPDGLLVRHRCHNPPCCNPAHLELGTDADNKGDSVKAKRHRWPIKRGEQHGAARLTADQVRSIRADTRSQRQIGISYGLNQAYVSQIKTGKRWSHI